MADKVRTELIKYFDEDILNIGLIFLMLLTLSACEYMTNEKLQYTVDAHSAQISIILRMLCKNCYLVTSGMGIVTHYQLNEAYASTHANVSPNAQATATPNAEITEKLSNDKSGVNNLADNGVTLALDLESLTKDKAKDNAT